MQCQKHNANIEKAITSKLGTRIIDRDIENNDHLILLIGTK